MFVKDPYISLREFARVDCLIPFTATKFAQDNESLAISRLCGYSFTDTRQVPTQLDDPNLSEWQKSVEKKLDIIINLLSLQNEGFTSLPIEKVNISGGGLNFQSKQHFNIGDLLELKLVLPFNTSVGLWLYGRVVKSEIIIDDKWSISVKYLPLQESIRDLIIKYVLSVQKEIIINRKA